MSYGPPQGNYGGPPPQQGYGYPQQGGYPPQGPPQGPPHGYPQQQQYQQGPPQHFQQGPPQGFPPQGPPPQQQGWGQPPPGQFGGPSMPSPGYDPRAAAQGDASRDADALRGAMKGFGTDEQVLINILSKPDPLQMALLRNTYNQRLRRSLEKDIKSETSRYFEKGLVALVRGPLMADVYGVRDAVKGLGTREAMLNDVLVGRTNADMNAIKQAYQAEFHVSLESDVRGDLSMKTKELFDMFMAARRAEESAPVYPQETDRTVADLYSATTSRGQQTTICNILTSKSDGQIRAIAQQYQQRYGKSLDSAIDNRVDNHMEDALLLLIRRATDRAMADAVQLEDAMAGLGTKDVLLVNRVVRIHWNRQHMDQVKRAYQHRYKRDLISRVKGEIDKDIERLLVGCMT